MEHQGPEEQLTVSFKAMQRMRTTIEDFTQSYFPYLGLSPAKDLFNYLDILIWVEATIYQLDEDNEALSRQGSRDTTRKLLEESVIKAVLIKQGLMDASIEEQLKQGDAYWCGERRLCAAMLDHSQRLHEQGVLPGTSSKSQEPISQLTTDADVAPREVSDSVPVPFTLEDVITLHEAKSFDYRVLHLLLRKLSGSPPDPLLWEFLQVDELLVDISDDLVDYEDDVEANSFNILRCYVHIFGQDAPLQLVKRISELEARHAELLAGLPEQQQKHYWSRHKEAAGQDGEGGRWVFPPLILDEVEFRKNLEEEAE